MRYIDMQNWPRREQFELFSTMGYPHFSLCANVDLTAFYPPVKERGVSFTVAFLYVLSRAANEIPEFRYRIREDRVIEHEKVHPSTTILVGEDIFSFCTMEYRQDFGEFAMRAEKTIDHVRQHPTLEDEPGQDDLLFMSAIPWVSFTSFMHPLHLNPADSVPRLAWGKYFQDGDRLKMPLSVHAHHAIMDGIHIGRYYGLVQDHLDNPGAVLNRG